jgi:rfaE bifunctional protein nucleotidyltransferase chain/domain
MASITHSNSATIQELLALPRPLVFTNGVFDILHSGHVIYLQEASKLGASLIVGVNSDSSVKMLNKDKDRPLNSEEDRAFLLSALRCVSGVHIFSEKTPMTLLRSILPDVYVKGGDYDMDKLDEKRFMDSIGGQALSLSFKKGYSSTALIEKIRSV